MIWQNYSDSKKNIKFLDHSEWKVNLSEYSDSDSESDNCEGESAVQDYLSTYQ